VVGFHMEIESHVVHLELLGVVSVRFRRSVTLLKNAALEKKVPRFEEAGLRTARTSQDSASFTNLCDNAGGLSEEHE
jgi:hypothetical protein